MNISLRADDFRVALHPPFPVEVIHVANIYGRFTDRRGLLNWLNKAMPQWVEQIVLCEELYDAKKGIWIDCMVVHARILGGMAAQKREAGK